MLFSTFQTFSAQFEISIRTFLNDNTLEYLSSHFQQSINFSLIVHRTSSSHTSQ